MNTEILMYIDYYYDVRYYFIFNRSRFFVLISAIRVKDTQVLGIFNFTFG